MTREEIKAYLKTAAAKEINQGSKKTKFILSVPDEDIRYIEESVCDIIGMDIEEMYDPERKGDKVLARQLTWYFLYEMGGTYQWIGERYGKKHETVMYGVKKMRDLARIGDKFHTFVIAELGKHFKEYFKQFEG